MRIELATHAGGGLLVLLVTTTLSVFKPWGRTRYGLRQELPERPETNMFAPPMPYDSDKAASTNRLPLGQKIFFAVIVMLVLGFVALHLAGGGLAGHGH